MYVSKVGTVTGSRSNTGSLKERRGAALVFAISMLAVFSALGIFYVRFMELELERSDIGLRERRARQLATAGVEVATARLQQFLKNPAKYSVSMDAPYVVELPTYSSISIGESGIEAQGMPAPRLAELTFTIHDESGKININHVPASVLQKVVGVSGEVARNIAASVPHAGGDTAKRWFFELDELVARGLLPKADFDALALDELLTPYTVINHTNPTGFINVNALTPTVLAALLDLSPEQVAQVKAKGPFSEAAALARAVAEARGVPVESVVVDRALGYKSRCFRVESQGRYAKLRPGVTEDAYAMASTEEKRNLLMNVATSRVEAVLLFEADGTCTLIHWNVDVKFDADVVVPT